MNIGKQERVIEIEAQPEAVPESEPPTVEPTEQPETAPAWVRQDSVAGVVE
jgi:hypothetical protein